MGGCHSYHGLDALGVEEAVVKGVHGVIGLHVTLSLQKDGAGVQTVVSPEYGEAGLLIPFNQSPAGGMGWGDVFKNRTFTLDLVVCP